MTTKTMEERFDEKFNDKAYISRIYKDKAFNKSVSFMLKERTKRDIKTFIRQELATARQEERERIIKKVLKITDEGFDCICSEHIKDKFKKSLSPKE